MCFDDSMIINGIMLLIILILLVLVLPRWIWYLILFAGIGYCVYALAKECFPCKWK